MHNADTNNIANSHQSGIDRGLWGSKGWDPSLLEGRKMENAPWVSELSFEGCKEIEGRREKEEQEHHGDRKPRTYAIGHIA